MWKLKQNRITRNFNLINSLLCFDAEQRQPWRFSRYLFHWLMTISCTITGVKNTLRAKEGLKSQMREATGRTNNLPLILLLADACSQEGAVCHNFEKIIWEKKKEKYDIHSVFFHSLCWTLVKSTAGDDKPTCQRRKCSLVYG